VRGSPRRDCHSILTMCGSLRPMNTLEGWYMKVCATPIYTSRRRRLFVICDWLSNSILIVLSLFFAMFCFVLFCIWYFDGLCLLLAGMDIVLVFTMSAVAVMFGMAAREVERDRRAPGDRAGANKGSREKA
jgi:hypothetical protein